jgi:hypothetical protein
MQIVWTGVRTNFLWFRFTSQALHISLFTKIFKVVICITHLTLRRHFTFHQQRFNSSYPSRQFPIPLKVTIALEIFTHNKPYFIHCRKKKLLAFPDLDSIHLFTCLWRNYPIFGYFKSSCHFWRLFRQVDQINIENNFIIHRIIRCLAIEGRYSIFS